MASIEVSLSSTPRRKKNGPLGNMLGSMRSIGGSKDTTASSKELETLRNALRDKENIIQTLKGQLNIPGLRVGHIRAPNMANNNNHNNNNNGNGTRELSDQERKLAEERLSRLRNDTDAKRLAIKNLKMALERLDVSDNIDVRIQQAELEFQLGREELNLLTLLEETRSLQHCLEESSKKCIDTHTLFSCLSASQGTISIHTLEINFDPKSPRFGAGHNDVSPGGLFVDWALEDTGLKKGDRLLEVNGKIVLTKTRDDLSRLLLAAPDPACLVILRKGSDGIAVSSYPNAGRQVSALRDELEVVKERAEESQRAKEGLRSDNIRLTHRISYLEEQVSELLSRNKSDNSDIRVLSQNPMITSTVKTSQNVTNINISSMSSANATPTAKDAVFQKGNQVTSLDSSHANGIPIRSKSSLSNISNTHIVALSPQPSEHSHHSCHHHKRNGKSRQSSSKSNLALNSNSSSANQEHKKHHHHHHSHHNNKEKYLDYNSETNSAVDSYNNRYLHHRKYDPNIQGNNLMDQSYRKATKIVHDLTKHNTNKERLFEKHSSKSCLNSSEKYNSPDILKHYNARKSTSVMDFRSEIHLGPKYSTQDYMNGTKSVEDLLGDPKHQDNHNKRLYKKLHDARSVKSLDFDSDKNLDYQSEPGSSHNVPNKPRPTPPKKPLRLSLHRAQSLQSVETPPATPCASPPPSGNESRKALKRNYRGEPPLVAGNTEKVNGYSLCKSESHGGDIKWTSFAQNSTSKKDLIYVQEAAHAARQWC